ncbi:hypothetical protein [Pseudonocardia parietis]|uniref:Uncharacterized protein n=1 Tax=Pseudonocardia parietis TaxID=570936 RepID=A0ABS4W6N5_9PSEU|nr:hypothetical protein [Pseudonocardia parietis]MBP2371872.1 hypothetical protein [Pseudonocardia parietis]
MSEPEPDTFPADAISADTVDGYGRLPAGLAGYQPVPGWSTAPESAIREVPAHERLSVHRLLESIDDLVRRHRKLAARDGADETLHAELIAAELDQQAAVLRRLGRQSRS